VLSDLEKKFARFGQTAAAAASLGQVHRATLPDGTDVACKLQYPDMASAVEADLRQLGIMLSLFEKYDRAIDTREIRNEIADRLHEELDYTREARHEKLYAHILRDEAGVHVPRVIDELSTGRLLTSTWLEGRPIMDFTADPQDVRDTIALNMFRAWYLPLYGYGIIHGDPHPGNYTVQADHSINLLDFGCVRVFPPQFIGGVTMLYHALQTDDADMAVAAYEKWGFRGLTRDTIDVLNVWARFLYGPVLDDKRRAIGDLPEKTVYGQETAQKVHAALREQGGITVPREFVFMDRAALGLGSVFLRLQAKVNWYRLFNELIADFDEKALGARQKKALVAFGLD
jgi:predicted unusual protein kinase regulating ubiquinone biosynthesis (AarF/ABC1/UbiB family)